MVEGEQEAVREGAIKAFDVAALPRRVGADQFLVGSDPGQRKGHVGGPRV